MQAVNNDHATQPLPTKFSLKCLPTSTKNLEGNNSILCFLRYLPSHFSTRKSLNKEFQVCKKLVSLHAISCI